MPKPGKMFSVERVGGVAVLRLSKPPVNAISFEDWLGFPDIIAALEADRSCKAVVICGTGGHFSAGNDRRQFDAGSRASLDAGTATVRDGLRKVAESSLISVAAITGAAMGSALGLVSMCDARIGTASSKLGLPEVKAGAFGGYRFVRDRLPEGEVRMMQLTGEPISGERAYQLGFFQELVVESELEQRAIDLAGRMTRHIRPGFERKVRHIFVGPENDTLWSEYELERMRGVDYLVAGT